MKPNDSLSDLLKAWQPRPPRNEGILVRNIMREIHGKRSRVIPSWTEWFPEPRLLFPLAASLVLLMTGFQWVRLNKHSKFVATQTWQSELARPLGEASLAGTYLKLEDKNHP